MDISYIPNTVKDTHRNLQWTFLIYQTQSRTHTETFNGHLLYNKHSQGRVQKPSMDISYITNTVKDAYRNLQWTSLIYQTQPMTHTETFNGHLVYTKHSQGRIQKHSMDISFITNTARDAHRNLQWTSLIYQTQSRTHTETFNGHLFYNKHSQGRIQKPSMDISFITNTANDTYRNLQWTSLL